MKLRRQARVQPFAEDETLVAWRVWGEHGVVELTAHAMAGLGVSRLAVKADGTWWLPIDVNCHSPRPLYKDHEKAKDPCHLMEADCYVHMDSHQATLIFREWKKANADDEVIFRMLEDRYEEVLITWGVGRERSEGASRQAGDVGVA